MLKELESPYSVSAAPMMPGLGSPFDRRDFSKACKIWHEIDRAANDLKYPKKFPEVRAVLAKHKLEPSDEQSDRVFEQMLERDRAVLATQLQERNRAIFEEAVTARVQALHRKLADRLREEAEKLETRERAEADRWKIPFHPSATLLSLAGTADRLAVEITAVWNGEPVERLLGAWFEKPLDLN